MVARQGRSVDAWMTGLRGVLSNRDYRTPSVTAETLWRIAEDPAASPSARAGAATALRGTLDAQGRERILAAAKASASPKLRIAFEAATAADDVPLANALAECEEEASTARAERRA